MLVGGKGSLIPKTKKCLKKELIKQRHKITNVPVHKMGLGVMNSTLANHLMGLFEDSKWSQHKIETFRGARNFFGPLHGPL